MADDQELTLSELGDRDERRADLWVEARDAVAEMLGNLQTNSERAPQLLKSLEDMTSYFRAAIRENGFARAAHVRRLRIVADHFEREISLDRGTYFRRPMQVNIEAAILELPRENCVDCSINSWPGRRIPNAINRRMQPQLHHDVVRFERAIRG